MLKADIITIHIGKNFGSVLQTIATCEILKTLGVLPIVVNYIPPRATYCYYWKQGTASLIKMLRRLLFFPIHYISNANFYKYLSSHCELSEKIYASDDFVKKCPKADLLITGSDQVWNYNHNQGIDKHYFFDGIKEKKIAFSSSIGMKELPENYRMYMQRALNEYSAVSVREDSALDLLSKIGINAVQLLDPTLLIDRSQWEKYAFSPKVKQKYLFVYLPYNTDNIELVYKTVRKIADNKQLKVVTYSAEIFNCKYADKTIKFSTPGDILSLILYADFVVTNSFHGTAFSINLNKQFYVYMPSHFSTRLESILNLCNLKDRILNDVVSKTEVNKVINFDESNAILTKERKKAIDFLTKAIEIDNVSKNK